MQAATALHHHFRDRKDVLVAMELVVYYQRGNDKVWLRPDVQVVFGVPRAVRRSTYKVWEEGKGPDFVLEVASPSTVKNDAGHKAQEYAQIGVREYWRLDPDGALMKTPLEGYVASGGRYGPVQPVVPSAQGGQYWSEVLGLELRSQRQEGATVLVFRDPRTGEEFDGELEEAERRRRIAERDLRAMKQRAGATERELRAEKDRANAAEQRANTAERELRAAKDRARALEERLRALTAHTVPPERTP